MMISFALQTKEVHEDAPMTAANWLTKPNMLTQ